MRTSGWRYTEWHPFNASSGVANWSKLLGAELYPHGDASGQSADCSWDYENKNVAGSEPALEKQLAAMLRTVVAH